MSSSQAGRGEARSRPIGAAAAAAAGALLVAAGALAGFAFYAPEKGRLATAAAQVAAPAERRDRVRVEVGEAMAPGGAGRPTLASVTRFFALEDDTLPCTVEENHGAEAAERWRRYAGSSLAAGTDVVLCLD